MSSLLATRVPVSVIRCRPTPYSPLFKPGKTPEPNVFALRTYPRPRPEKPAFLPERIGNFTTRLFAQHGMENMPA